MFEGLWPKLIGVLVIGLGLVAAFFGIKRSGKKEAEQAQLAQSFKQAKEADATRKNVDNMSKPELDTELHKSQRD